MRAWLLVHHHPEFVRRLMAWIESKQGQVGVGGGWRATGAQPARDGFAPEGRSFHQNQTFNDGFIGAAAVDLVARDGPDVNFNHDGVAWSMVPRQGSADAKKWGVHCNIDSEAWHMQPVEIDGWQSWVNAGRPAPKAGYPIPAPPSTGDVVNWNPTAATVTSIKDAPPVDTTVANKNNDWAMIAMLKAIQKMAGLPVTGKYDQSTANVVDANVA
jgi:hypothetical protein